MDWFTTTAVIGVLLSAFATLATQISLAPPVVDDGGDDHRADNYNQQPRKFGVEHAQA